MPALSKAADDDSSKIAIFKQMDSERVRNDLVVKGKQVTRPVRFFVSEPRLKLEVKHPTQTPWYLMWVAACVYSGGCFEDCCLPTFLC